MSGNRGRAVDSIRNQISQLKTKIDEVETRETNAKSELSVVKSRQIFNETEVKSLTNRKESVQAELDSVNKRLHERMSKLGENDIRSKETGDYCKKLQDKEDEGFESLRELENEVRILKYDNEEMGNKNRESALREKALQVDLARVEARLKRATDKAESLEIELEGKINATNEIENTVNRSHEREDDVKERMAFLNDQLKQVTALCEDRNAKEKTAQRLIEKLSEEIIQVNEKMREIEKQFEEIEQEC